MKKLMLFLFMLGTVHFSAQAQSDNAPAATEQAKIEFQVSEHDFGDLQQGDKVEWVFTFENTGTAPLVLTNVSTTCGCTAPQWPREPILPGEEAEIHISFNSAGKMGRQNKVITIYSNAVNNPERIKIVANVMKKG